MGGLARVIGVVGASGGIGTTCLAAALATRAAATGRRVACADAGPWGGGIEAVFDLESCPGARWPDLADARGRLDGAVLLRHLPQSTDGVRVLSATTAEPGTADEATGPTRPAAVATVLGALARAVDTLVLDLGTAPAGGREPSEAMTASGDLLLVVGSGVPALSRASRAAAAVTVGDAERVWLVQRCPRGRADLAGLVAERLGLPLLGAVYDDPRLDDALVRGVAPGSTRGRIGDVADRLLSQLWREEGAA